MELSAYAPYEDAPGVGADGVYVSAFSTERVGRIVILGNLMNRFTLIDVDIMLAFVTILITAVFRRVH